MKIGARKVGPRLRVVLYPGVWLGPGRADLLEGIALTGSIAAAGRRLGMSYKRAWLLIEEMNTQFKTPVVTAAKGGVHGGGSKLTRMGEDILRRYRRMEQRTTAVISSDMKALQRQLGDMTKRK